MKLATIDLHKGKFYIGTSSLTQAGFAIATDHILVVEETDPSGLAPALRAALEMSRSGVPTPPVTADLTRALLEASSSKSWRAFAKDAKCVGAVLENRELKLTPYRKVGLDSFEPISDKARMTSIDSDQIAEIVLEVFRETQ